MLPWLKIVIFSFFLLTWFTITQSVNHLNSERIEIVYNSDSDAVDLSNFSELIQLLIPAEGSLEANIRGGDPSKVNSRYGVPQSSKEGSQSRQSSRLKTSQGMATDLKKAIRNTTIPCDGNETLCDGYTTELNCVDGLCQCPNSSCWVYNTNYYGIFKYDISFTCGNCGQLGSDCKTYDCDPPGTCLSDNYCHCSVGERYSSDPDVCVVYHSPTSTSLFLAALLFFLLIGLFALCYSFFANYRSTGYVIWCRDPRWSRGRRLHNRRNATFGPPKSPAFTMDVINRNEETPISILSDISSRNTRNSNYEATDRDMELGTPSKEEPTYIDLEYAESEEHVKSLQQPSVKKKSPILMKLTVSNLEIHTSAQVYDKNDSTDPVPKTNKLDKSSDKNFNKSEESCREISADTLIEDTSGMTMYYEEYESSCL